MPVPAETQPTLSFDKSEYTATQVGETFTLNLVITNVQNLWAWKVGVTWDPQRLSLVGQPTEGNFLQQAGFTLYVVMTPKTGYIKEMSCNLLVASGVSGSGVLATFTFSVTSQCVESPINLVNTTLLLPDVDPSTGTDQISHQVPQPAMTVSLFIGSGPVANAGLPQTVDEDTEMTLNGSKTLTGNQSVTFTWRFLDGGPKELNGTIVNYTFDIPGTYDVTLTVQDSTGATSDDTVQVTVRDITPPVPVISIDGDTSLSQTLLVGKRVTISGSQSYDPEGGRIVSYLWDTGGESNTIEQSFTYQYDKAGTYNIALTVFDQRGNNSATKIVTIKVDQGGGPGGQNGGQGDQNNPGGSDGSDGSNGSNGNPGGQDGGGQYQTVNLPPLAIGILATMTVITISGSAFWLRKRNVN
jgi:PKD repeat protein